MYKEIGQVSGDTILEIKSILEGDLRWESHISDTTNHQAVACMTEMKTVDEIVARWPIDTWQQMLFLRLKPGGKLYRHRDEGFGFHIPVETNKDAVSLSFENGVWEEHHLEVGKLYHVDRSIEHESFNNGSTDRTHLIALLRESDNE